MLLRHTIANHFNFLGDSVPQGPLAYGILGTGGSAPRVHPGLRHFRDRGLRPPCAPRPTACRDAREPTAQGVSQGGAFRHFSTLRRFNFLRHLPAIFALFGGS